MSLQSCPEFLYATKKPQQPAIVWGGRIISWLALNNYIFSTARYLKEISIKSHDRVILVDDNSPVNPIVILSLWRIGAVVCPCARDGAIEDTIKLYAASGAYALIGPRSMRNMLGPRVRWVDIEQVVAYGYNDSFLGSESALDPKIDLNSVAVLIPVISSQGIVFQELTHADWCDDPKVFNPLWHLLSSGEPLAIN